MNSTSEKPIPKRFVSPQQFLEDSIRLGLQILESGFRPSYIVAIWRGGTPIGIAVQELLDYYGVPTDHIAIRTSLYAGIDRPAADVSVAGLEYLVNRIDAEDRLLLVDDIFDSGRSVAAVIDELSRRCRRNTPGDIRIATMFYRRDRRKVDLTPDFYLHETDRWIVFPHGLEGLNREEIARKGMSLDLPPPG